MTPAAVPQRIGWLGTLKARLMLASALVIAASVAVSTSMVLSRVEKRSEQALMDLESDNAGRMASLLGQRVVAMQKMLRATAETMPPAARQDPLAAADYLGEKPALGVTFSTLYIATAGGQMLALHDGRTAAPRAMNLADRDYFRQTVDKGIPVVSAPIPGRASIEPVIVVTMPVFDAEGRVAAVIAGGLRLASRNLFDDLTYAGNSGESNLITIVTDAQGSIVSHPQRDRVLRSIETEPNVTDAVARWVAQGRPVEPNGFVVHENGFFISMAGVPGADWMVFRVAPDTELMGGLVQARQEAVGWAGGVALVGSLMILALLAVLLGPLARLQRRTQQLQDPTLALDQGWPQAHGEIGELSQVLQQALRGRAEGEAAKHALAQQMSSVLAAAPIGIGFTRARRFELAGAEFSALLGWADGELLGRPAREIYASEDEYDALGPEVAAAFAAGRPYFGELQFRRRDGSTFWGRLQGRPVSANDPDAGTIWLLEDVTERREAHERLSWSAHHDALTRLLNRAAFEVRLAEWVAHPRPGVPAALLFIDLDHFKQINDSAGHAAGDTVLREVATVLQEHVRADDAAARLGGDEFGLLLPGCVSAVALQLGERLRAAISRVGVEHAGRRMTVGASIGVVEIDPAGVLPPTEWLARADAACYEAKHAGRGVVRLAGSVAPLRLVS
jgi:diguanylate cyclase (GGDEF)-like protein/PAS domain S-box-containing protein